jgi:hypothetical protein
MNETVRWQHKLLPFIIVVITALACFFFWASYRQFYQLRNFAQSSFRPTDQTNTDFYRFDRARDDDSTKFLVLADLERNVLLDRERQAIVWELSTLWGRYLAFATGMVFAVIGSAFILSKLSEPETRLEASTGRLETAGKVSLQSSSPGLILAGFGTLLMMMALLMRNPATAIDHAVFLSGPFETETSPAPPDRSSQVPANRH